MDTVSTENEVGEFLIGPASDRTRALLKMFAERLKTRGFRSRALYFERAGSVGVVVAKGDTPMPASPEADFEILEDQWPEALGFRIACIGDRIEAQSDHFSIRPLFWAKSDEGQFVGTSLQWVGAAIGAKIDPRTAVELMVVSFNLGDHTVLTDVIRLNPGEQWVKEGSAAAVINKKAVGISTVGPTIARCTSDEGRPLLTNAADRIVEMMADNACMELSGGMDSRCVLALANSRGVRPKFAFTLGSEDSENVVLARELCEKSGIEHRRISLDFDLSNIEQDSRDYLEAAGYQVNATSVCWMPVLFRLLAPDRDTQICGQMASTAFYYTPFDPLNRFDAVLRKWVDMRVLISGNRAPMIFGNDIHQSGLNLVRETAMKAIRDAGGSFRDGGDEFFIFQRNRQWAAGWIHAARYWYRNHAPMIDRRVAEWTWRSHPRDKVFRINQMRLCEDLGGPIAGVPFEGGYRCPTNGLGRLQTSYESFAKLARGVRGRLSWKRRRPDMNADNAAVAMLSSGNLKPGIIDMLSDVGSPDPEQVMDHIDANIGSHEREIGFLVTLSLLREHLQSIARDLDASLAGR